MLLGQYGSLFSSFRAKKLAVQKKDSPLRVSAPLVLKNPMPAKLEDISVSAGMLYALWLHNSDFGTKSDI
jgi:hypothetical protein